ncbi:MAG: methylmalonyl Co-A mutase-associated GTPase MeaB [Planctomycetes bacterium]|nr:methylmalonyl Co-A mutase-associated GTPase MeaB [Planctomycetota bacterium]
MPKPQVEQLVAGVLARDRRAIARAITLVESLSPSDLGPGRELMERLASHAEPCRRIGVSGIPGVGKSTFVETFGMHLVEQGSRVAVLAVDPSSSLSGGAILGDKTRMERLSRSEQAFIRPTAGGDRLGGIAPRTREAILVCEAAGFDVVIVETIGVGQSEAAVRDVVDMFVLLTIAGAGDDLQGIKRGVLELADVILVNKADGDGELRARHAAAELRSALQILHGARPERAPDVDTCSAVTGIGIDTAWSRMSERFQHWECDGRLTRLRADQDLAWFDRKVDELLRVRFLSQRADAIEAARDSVRHGAFAPSAAHRLLLSEP